MATKTHTERAAQLAEYNPFIATLADAGTLTVDAATTDTGALGMAAIAFELAKLRADLHYGSK
jgi:hypothetical protein